LFCLGLCIYECNDDVCKNRLAISEAVCAQIGFGSRFEKLFPHSVEYNEASLQKAQEHCDRLVANLGGTEILPPLLDIFKERPKEGIPRQVFLMTDGEVQNTKECIDCVRKNAETTRVFTFGIGDEASEELVRGMAEAGEGKAEFIRTGDNFEEKVMRQLQRALKPAFTDLSLEWPASAGIVQQTPYESIFADSDSFFLVAALTCSGQLLFPAPLLRRAPGRVWHTACRRQGGYCHSPRQNREGTGSCRMSLCDEILLSASYVPTGTVHRIVAAGPLEGADWKNAAKAGSAISHSRRSGKPFVHAQAQRRAAQQVQERGRQEGDHRHLASHGHSLALHELRGSR
jgi:hypothetical protein